MGGANCVSARSTRKLKKGSEKTVKTKVIALAAVALLVTMTAAQAQEFLQYEGKNAVSEGDGGAKKIVDDIEFWTEGAPPKRFKLLGYVTDRRHKSGIWGKISMSSLESDIAKVAKENGGDAVILMSSDAETIGVVGHSFGSVHGNANTTGSGNTTRMGNMSTNTFSANTTFRASGSSTSLSSAVQKNNSKYAVVTYLSSNLPLVETQPKAATPESTDSVTGRNSSQSDSIDVVPATPAAK